MALASNNGSTFATVVAVIGISLVAAGVGIFINEDSAKSCLCICSNQNCTAPGTGISINRNCTAVEDHERCKEISLYMKVPLIATHLLIFALGPAAMYVFYDRSTKLEQWGAKSPFRAVLGFGFIMVAICGEIGWHVGQRWFYHEDYHILNFVFYAFLTLGTSQWALGVRMNSTGIDNSTAEIADIILIISTPLAAVFYALAAYASCDGIQGATKVPIYIVLCAQYIILSWRLYKLLSDNLKVLWFPFFSVGVNLFFIFLLNQFQKSTFLNPLFHILHDALGTEMGILIIAYIVWEAAKSEVHEAKKVK